MTLKYACAAAFLSGGLLANAGMALAQQSSPTSGAIPPLPSLGTLPPSTTSGALPGSTTVPVQGLGASPSQSPLTTPEGTVGAPYQPPCGTYPLPQC